MADEPVTPVSIKNFPIKFDTTSLPFFPSEWNRKLKNIKNTSQSEGGKDIVQTIRTGKLSMAFSCSIADDEWVSFFEQYNDKDSFTLSIYSPRTHTYEERTVRMESYSAKPKRRSEGLTEVAGVWDVSFTLEEF